MIGLAIASPLNMDGLGRQGQELAGARRRATKALKVIGHRQRFAEAVHALDGAKGPVCSGPCCGR